MKTGAQGVGNGEKSGVLGGVRGAERRRPDPPGPWISQCRLLLALVDHLWTTLAPLSSLRGTQSFASLPHLFREDNHGDMVGRHFQRTENDL